MAALEFYGTSEEKTPTVLTTPSHSFVVADISDEPANRMFRCSGYCTKPRGKKRFRFHIRKDNSFFIVG